MASDKYSETDRTPPPKFIYYGLQHPDEGNFYDELSDFEVDDGDGIRVAVYEFAGYAKVTKKLILTREKTPAKPKANAAKLKS